MLDIITVYSGVIYWIRHHGTFVGSKDSSESAGSTNLFLLILCRLCCTDYCCCCAMLTVLCTCRCFIKQDPRFMNEQMSVLYYYLPHSAVICVVLFCKLVPTLLNCRRDSGCCSTPGPPIGRSKEARDLSEITHCGLYKDFIS